MSRNNVAIVGAGPAGLMAAEVLSAAGCAVTVYERMPTPARRFLMAGVGGLNLTHSEAFDAFATRYREAAPMLRPALDAFGPRDMRAWADGLGADTFVGSSGRVFPRAMKASPLLRAWLVRLEGRGVRLLTRHDWRGWDGDALIFDMPDGPRRVRSDATVLALGGASWPRLGSDGSWTGPLSEAGIAVAPLVPSNCGILIPWSAPMARFAGTPLKTVALSFGGETVRGEAVVTRAGLEGGAVYALSPLLRGAVAAGTTVPLAVDLKPGLTAEALAARLAKARKGDSLSNVLRKAARLDPVAVAILREGGEVPRDPAALAARIKAVPLPVTGIAGLARAISTAGGVRFGALDTSLMLRARPGVFVAGEMLDWEAPTGGYLLQASFATGAWAARGALDRLSTRSASRPTP